MQDTQEPGPFSPHDRQKYFNLPLALEAYRQGKNITEVLRAQSGIQTNTSEIIEIAYDLQAGSYIKDVESNLPERTAYAEEMAGIIDKRTSDTDTFLDVGTGELTMITLVLQSLANAPARIFAFDISWSRLWKGLSFARTRLGPAFSKLCPFAAVIEEIPLLDKSIDVTISSHALEPNGGREEALLQELFRVTNKVLMLFEPCYEMNTEAGRRRMRDLGYIRGLDSVIGKLGGELIEKIRIENVSNPLNPTYCFVIKPPAFRERVPPHGEKYCDPFAIPGTNSPLKRIDNTYFSETTGLCFPIIRDIPILRRNAAILASAMGERPR